MEKPIDQWFISTILATKNLSKKSSWISRPIELMTAEAISTGWWLSPLSPLKNMTSSVGKYIYIYIPNIWKNKSHVPNHQAD